MKYALIKDGVAINVTEWDGVSEWHPDEGIIAVQNDTAAIGDTYADGIFTHVEPPPAPPTPQPTLAELQAQLATLTAQIALLANQQP